MVERTRALLKRRHRNQWLAWLAGLALVCGGIAWVVGNLRARTTEIQQDRLIQQARLMESVLGREFGAIDAALVSVIHDLPDWQREHNQRGLQRRLIAMASALSSARTLAYLDEQGTVVSASRDNLIGIQAAERDYFKAARASNDAHRLYVSEPYRTVLGVWTLNLSRVVQHPDGRFAGLVSATLDPDFLDRLQRQAAYAPDMWASLAHSGGLLLSLVPPPKQAIEGMNIARPGSMFMRHRESGREENLFTGPVAATGEQRLMAIRTLRPPEVTLTDTLVLAVSRDIAAVEQNWRHEARSLGAVLLMMMLLSGGGLAWVQAVERRSEVESAQARVAVQAAEQRWALALDGAGLGVWDWDPRGDRMFRSRQAKAVLGVAPEDAADSIDDFRRRIHPDDQARVKEAFDDLLAGRAAVFDSEHRIVGADGRTRWVHAHASVVAREPDGQATRMIGTVADISARREAEQLRTERDRAEAASRAKTDFLSRMSHELRTPLNAVLGFTQLLKLRLGQQSADEQRVQLGHIEAAGQNLLKLVNDVLELTRIERDGVEVQREPVSLAPLLAALVESLAPQAQQRALTLTLADLAPDAVVLADPIRLRQVLTHLVGNAIKYNRPGGSVTLALRPDPAGWCVVVTDTGIGMSAAQLTHLYEPFNRLGHASSAVEGAGLGLVLSRWLVDAMGGTIRVHSSEGVGSSFEVSLPAAAA